MPKTNDSTLNACWQLNINDLKPVQFTDNIRCIGYTLRYIMNKNGTKKKFAVSDRE